MQGYSSWSAYRDAQAQAPSFLSSMTVSLAPRPHSTGLDSKYYCKVTHADQCVGMPKSQHPFSRLYDLDP